MCILFFFPVAEGRLVFDAVRESPTSVLVVAVTFSSVWSVLGLAGFHTYLAASNQTTNEDVSVDISVKLGKTHFFLTYRNEII